MLHTSSSVELSRMLREMGARRIAVDGINGVGKSHLARDIGVDLGLPTVDLDDYLISGRRSFVSNLRMEQLDSHINVKQEFVLAGVCMLEVLKILGLQTDAIVYIKRITDGRWQDEPSLVPMEPEEEHVAALRAAHEEIIATLGEERSFELDEEVIRYHIRHLPHQHASICYEHSAA